MSTPPRKRPSSSSPTSSRRVRSAHQAVRLLITDLQRAVSCVTTSVLVPVRAVRAGPESPVAITFSGSTARAKVATDRWISIAMEVRPGREKRKPDIWRTHTASYAFALFGSPRGPDEQLCYHYHPASGVDLAHLHVNAEVPWVKGGLRKKHLPTGRSTIEDFIELLIDELEVRARRRDWRQVLAENRKVFSARRNW